MILSNSDGSAGPISRRRERTTPIAVTNAKVTPVNVTADAAVAINDVQALITGHDFAKKLTENRSLALGGLASSLTAVNSALNLLPPNEPLVYGYDRGRQTLIARTFQ